MEKKKIGEMEYMMRKLLDYNELLGGDVKGEEGVREGKEIITFLRATFLVNRVYKLTSRPKQATS